MYYKVLTVINVVTICHQNYYSIIGCSLYNVLFIPVTDLFHNWKFVALDLLQLFQPSLHSSPLGKPPVLCTY